MKCEKCGEECDRDEVDVGVGIIYGPYGCAGCGWSSAPEYDGSEGIRPAELEHHGYIADSMGGLTSKQSITDRLLRFGIEGIKL